jgi:hypothetical protein
MASCVLGIARWLTPSPTGVGTHERLGLPPCLFLKFFGLPCPSCGLTTSFAHAARFHFVRSALTQPFGLAAFLMMVLLVPASLVLWQRRVPVNRALQARGVDALMYAMVALYLIGWVYKMASMR